MGFVNPADIAKGMLQSQFDEIERLQRIIADLWLAVSAAETARQRFYASGNPNLHPTEARLRDAMAKARNILA